MQVDKGERVSASTDPAIELFGRDIPSASSPPSLSTLVNCSQQDAQSENDQMELVPNDLGNSSGSNDGCEEVSPTCTQKIVGGIQKVAVACSQPIETIKIEDAQGLAAAEKTSKKPDKPIPCPRCESMDTKFCYFNNYNVNQPRHFCRKCQRYWTAGGSLRNVPIGAGRRKHKHASLHQRHTAIPDTMKVRGDSIDMARCSGAISSTMVASPGNQLTYGQQMRLHVPALEVCATPAVDNPYSLPTKSTVSSFGQESPLCRSMAATTLTMHNCAAMQNHGKFNGGQVIAPPDVKVEHADNVLSEHGFLSQGSIHNATNMLDDASTGASVCVDNHASENLTTIHQVASGLVSQEGEKEISTSSDDYVKQVTGFSAYGGPWQLGSSTPWNNPANAGAMPTLDGGAHPLCSPNLPPRNGAAPGGLWTSLPWPLMYPPAMWPLPLDWASSWAAMQWGPAAAAAVMMQHAELASAVWKPQLEGSNSDGCLLVPKTLRINDPVDAARSSIWTTLGLGDGPASSPRGSAPNIFQAKFESKDTNEENSTTPKRHSNPAAFSRSVAFNENS